MGNSCWTECKSENSWLETTKSIVSHRFTGRRRKNEDESQDLSIIREDGIKVNNSCKPFSISCPY